MSEQTGKQPSLELLQLQQAYKLKLPEKIDEIEVIWSGLKLSQDQGFTVLHLKLHSLVGTAGTYNALVVSNLARKIEIIIKSLLNNEIELNNELIASIDSYLLDLREISEKWQPSDIPYISQVNNSALKESSNWNKNIFLVEDDVELILPLIDFLESEGYKVFYFRDINQFENVYHQHESASAIIMDMSFNEGHVAGADTIKRLSEEDENIPPVIFISVHDDIEARLAAAQVGAKRYFTKPINKSSLLSSLDSLTHRSETSAYKILLIDDEKEIVDYYSTVLINNGFEVRAFTDPIAGYKDILSFDPDLILLDLYMPVCSGFDLAKIIRQNDDYAHLPIVFLSSEMDIGTQLAAMDLGGDDFLMKPVETEHLIQAMTSRVKRYRRINKLNTKLKEALIESEYRLVTLDQHAIVSIADEDGNISYINEQFKKISGYEEDELLGKNFAYTGSKKHQEVTANAIWNEISSGEIWRGQVCNLGKNNKEFWLELTIVPFLSESGKPYKYIAVGTNITEIKFSELKAHEDEMMLIKAKDESDRANSMKTEFLANMSHELRTPLNAISGFAQLLLMDEDKNLNDEQRDSIEEIEKASSHLLLLISELLNLSQIEAGKFRFNCETVGYTDIVVECVNLMHSLIERKGIHIEYKNEDELIDFEHFVNLALTIYVDPVRFKQIFINILNNALNYNSDNGKVIIATNKIDNSLLKISITDTGEEITEKNLEQLFISHSRLGKEETNIEGTGLGLVISKKLTNAMGGKIGVNSEVGKGTTFWLEFPLNELDLMRI